MYAGTIHTHSRKCYVVVKNGPRDSISRRRLIRLRVAWVATFHDAIAGFAWHHFAPASKEIYTETGNILDRESEELDARKKEEEKREGRTMKNRWQ